MGYGSNRVKTIKAEQKIDTKSVDTKKPQRGFYDELVDKLVEKLEFAKAHKVGLGSALGYGTGRKGKDGEVVVTVWADPANFSTKKEYSGINDRKFTMAICLSNYNTGWFGTFRQWKEAGCMVRKGEKSVSGMRWIELTDEQIEANQKAIAQGKAVPHPNDEFPTYYYVFNLEQVDAVSPEGEALLNDLRNLNVRDVNRDYIVVDPVSGTDAYGESWYTIPQLDEIKLDGVKIVNKGLSVFGVFGETLNVAGYEPDNHQIKIPPMIGNFKSSAHYYKTLLHELAHSTGKVFGRSLSTDMQSTTYANEELIAELSAWLLGVQFGLVAFDDPSASSPAYINTWLKNLKESPDYLKDIMAEVNKVCRQITKALETKISE